MSSKMKFGTIILLTICALIMPRLIISAMQLVDSLVCTIMHGKEICELFE
eukprot:gene3639-6455_t